MGTPPPVYTLNVAGFMKALEAQLKNNVAGYSIGLNQNGSRIAQDSWGWAKEPEDGGQAWTPDTRMHVASLSKIPTAIAMTKLLGDLGIPPTTSIIDYLPTYWVKGPNIENITFSDLLTHNSGLAFNNSNSRSDFAWLKTQIEVGTYYRSNYSYQNVNYGLCRILLATLNGDVPADTLFPGWQGSVDCLWDCSTITAYTAYVANEVFAPSEVTGPDFTHDATDAFAYDFPVTGPWDSGDLTYMVGGAGWHMTLNEVLAVMGTFRRGGTIVSPAQAETMLADHWGINYAISTNLGQTAPDNQGTYYVKYAGWSHQQVVNQTVWEEEGEAFFLPLGMELVVLVNSPVNGQQSGPGPASGPTLEQWVATALTNNVTPPT
jgi:Beta-lactamase